MTNDPVFRMSRLLASGWVLLAKVSVKQLIYHPIFMLQLRLEKHHSLLETPHLLISFLDLILCLPEQR
jgi:hypothetical protein